MAAEQTSKSSKHKLKFGGNDGKDSSKHDTSNHAPCCSLKTSTTNESNKSLCSKLKNNSCFVEKQESKCCVLKQRKSELPKKQVVKKEVENVSVIPPLSTTEELSKAKKRRLRKKKVLAIYTGSKLQIQPAPKVHLVKSEPIVKPNPTLESKEIKPEVPKVLAKELRKRSEKTILEARKKKITTKSPPKDSPVIARKIIPVEPDACYNKLNIDSSKIVEPSLPRFYFPNNQSASWNGRSNIGNNSVFYFGETKNELEELSAFKSFSTVNNKYDLPKKDNSYSFSSVKRKSEPISLNKFNQDENVFVNPARVFAINQNQEGNNFDFFNPSNVFMVNQNQVQYSIQDTKLNFVNSNIAANIVKQIETPSDNIDKNLIQVDQLNDSVNQNLIKIDPISDNFVPDCLNKKTMDSGDLAQSNKAGKSREEVLAEREAKKAAKLAAKNKHKVKLPDAGKDEPSQVETKTIDNPSNVDKTIPKRRTVVDRARPTTVTDDGTHPSVRCVDCVDGEIRGSKYSLKSSFGPFSPLDVVTDKVKRLILSSNIDGKDKQEKTELIDASKAELIDANKTGIITEDKLPEPNKDGKSKAELRAERRAKQEAQRAAKSSTIKESAKKTPQVQEIKPKVVIEKKVVSTAAKPPTHHKAKLFSHLYQAKKSNLALYQKLNTGDIHPAIIRLGSQYASRVVNGSNARCIALLHALKQMICDYKTPAEKEFSRGLEGLLTPVTDYLNHCRPLSVSMTNALRHIKWHLTQLPNDVSDVQAQKKLCDIVDTYIREQIDVAGEAICNTVQRKIANGDVILTYGCSSLIYRILVESHRSGTKFRVVVVDAGPWLDGREMLRRLVDKGLQCSYVLISATSFIMREVSKVLLGAHALLANGYVMSRAGSSQVALLAHSFNVPVLVCCETHKFSERVQTDAFVYNELGDPEEFVPKEKWTNFTNLTPLTLAYDVTPPELVTAVVTELAILPCTSVPVILRIKPSESLM